MMKWFCSFKSYGDFVIACGFLRRYPNSQNGLICGTHLIRLFNAIGFSGTVKWIDINNQDVPALFDVKSQGVYRAICSILKIRKSLLSKINRNDILVFDKLSFRERLVSWPFHTEGIKGCEPNIYLDYAKYFGCRLNTSTNRRGAELKSIAIFPDSRLIEKALDDRLIGVIVNECVAKGIAVKVVRVGPSVMRLNNSEYKSEYIDGFEALVKSIISCDAIISTDSLPAHLAEYFSIPVFVLTPKKNDYWMPYSVLVNKSFTLFDDLTPFYEWLS